MKSNRNQVGEARRFSSFVPRFHDSVDFLVLVRVLVIVIVGRGLESPRVSRTIYEHEHSFAEHEHEKIERIDTPCAGAGIGLQ